MILLSKAVKLEETESRKVAIKKCGEEEVQSCCPMGTEFVLQNEKAVNFSFSLE